MIELILITAGMIASALWVVFIVYATIADIRSPANRIAMRYGETGVVVHKPKRRK